MTKTCTHLDRIDLVRLPESVADCEDCLAIGGTWCYVDEVGFVVEGA